MYLYEMHSHTSEVSTCATATASELITTYKRLGYAGVCITDHFLNSEYANVDLNLPWAKQVNAFMQGYENAKAEGEKQGIDVFFGWEYRYFYKYGNQRFQDFLTYGLDKEWLLANPDCVNWGFLKYCDEVHKAGGKIIYAHPFRGVADYEKPAFDKLDYIDGIEACNGTLTEEERVSAFTYAIKHNMPISCGGDNHSARDNKLYAFEFGYKQPSLQALLKNIIDNSGKIVNI